MTTERTKSAEEWIWRLQVMGRSAVCDLQPAEARELAELLQGVLDAYLKAAAR